jgi:hypothetical protein
MAEIASEVLGKEVRFQQTTFEAYKARFLGFGMSDAMAQGMTDMAWAKNEGLDNAVQRVGGLVLIDGAYPIAMFDDAGKQKVRTQFRRLGWIMRILAALGRSARMSPAEAADVVIEMDAVNGELGPDFAALECPTVFVVGTGAHSGATEEEMRTVRAAAADAEESNKRVSVFATTPHKHTQILKKAPDTVVAAIEDVVIRRTE